MIWGLRPVVADLRSGFTAVLQSVNANFADDALAARLCETVGGITIFTATRKMAGMARMAVTRAAASAQLSRTAACCLLLTLTDAGRRVTCYSPEDSDGWMRTSSITAAAQLRRRVG